MDKTENVVKIMKCLDKKERETLIEIMKFILKNKERAE